MNAAPQLEELPPGQFRVERDAVGLERYSQWNAQLVDMGPVSPG